MKKKTKKKTRTAKGKTNYWTVASNILWLLLFASILGNQIRLERKYDKIEIAKVAAVKNEINGFKKAFVTLTEYVKFQCGKRYGI